MAKASKKEPELREVVGQHVRLARNAAGLTQAKLAEYAELSPETVSRLERGFYSASVATLLALADALDVTLDVLVGRELPTQSGSAAGKRISQQVELLDLAGQQTVLKVAELLGSYASEHGKSGRRPKNG